MFKYHTNCEKCGSSDANAVYEDDSTYCFSCGKAHDPHENKSTPTLDPKRSYPQMTSVTPYKPVPLTYLPLKVRGISKEVCEKMGVGYGRDRKRYYPHYVQGDLVGYKVKFQQQDGTKQFRWAGSPGSKAVAGLWGKAFATTPWKLVITEGEDDALAVMQMLKRRNIKASVVSVPFGAQSGLRYIKDDIEWVESFDDIYVCTDMDAPGRKLNNELMEFLDPSKAKEIILPAGYKDAGEMLVDGKIDQFVDAFYAALPRVPEGVQSTYNSLDNMTELYTDDTHLKGTSTGYAGLDAMLGGGYRPGELITVAAGTGVGKAQTLDTPIIMSDGGVKLAKDIRPGDLLCNGVIVEDVTPVWVDRPCYRVTFDDGTHYTVDENHDWWVAPRKRDRSHTEKRETKAMAKDFKYADGRKRYAVPIVPVSYPKKSLPFDPYTLGVWLGDGTSCAGRFTIGSKDVDSVISHIPYPTFSPAGNGGKAGERVTIVGITELSCYITKAGLKNNKHIPLEYYHTSRHQRLELLRGLLDTDGGVERGVAVFYNKRKHIAEGVVDIARSLGYKCRLYESRATLYGEDCGPAYRVTIVTNNHTEPLFYLERKQSLLKNQQPSAASKFITNIEQVENASTVCFQVSGGLYQLGGYTLTHNSSTCRNLALKCVQQKTQFVYLPLEDMPARNTLRLTGMHMGTNLVHDNKLPVELVRAKGAEVLEYMTVCTRVDALSFAVRVRNAKVVFIDHLTQLVEGKGEDSRLLVEKYTSFFTELAKKYNLTVVMVTHLSRDKEDPNDTHVSLNRLKHSTAIAQASDLVVGLTRPRDEHVTTVKILKGCRNVSSPVSEFQLRYFVHDETMREDGDEPSINHARSDSGVDCDGLPAGVHADTPTRSDRQAPKQAGFETTSKEDGGRGSADSRSKVTHGTEAENKAGPSQERVRVKDRTADISEHSEQPAPDTVRTESIPGDTGTDLYSGHSDKGEQPDQDTRGQGVHDPREQVEDTRVPKRTRPTVPGPLDRIPNCLGLISGEISRFQKDPTGYVVSQEYDTVCKDWGKRGDSEVGT